MEPQTARGQTSGLFSPPSEDSIIEQSFSQFLCHEQRGRVRSCYRRADNDSHPRNHQARGPLRLSIGGQRSQQGVCGQRRTDGGILVTRPQLKGQDSPMRLQAGSEIREQSRRLLGQLSLSNEFQFRQEILVEHISSPASSVPTRRSFA